MIGLILAAGYGTRLHPITLHIPKTLIELEPGVSILDYIVNVFRGIGIDHIYVVTRKDVVHFFYGRNDVDVLVVDVSEGDGNLWTLHQAIKQLVEKGVEDDIVLSMSDHIYEFSMVNKLIKVAKNSSKVYMCLDRLVRGRDAVEGLKIIVSGDIVVLSGKNVPPYSGIDTGLFYIPRNIFSYINKVVSEKGRKASLSDLINVLAQEGLVSYVDVSGSLWQDIDTLEDVERARKIYWKILAKNLVKESDGIVSKYLNRRISTRISLAFYKARIFVNPNIVTLIVFAIGLLASALVFMGSTWLGAILMLVSSILDGVDGELARLFKAQTKFGAFLDTLLDRIVDVTFMSAMFYQLLLKLLPTINSLYTSLYIALFGLTLLGSTYVSYVSNLVENRDYIAKLRNSFPWPTRDVRAVALAIATLLNSYEIGFMYVSFSSWFFILRVLIYKLREDLKIRGRTPRFYKIKLPHAKPVIRPSAGLLIEEIFLYSVVLAILLYLTGIAIDKISYYKAFGEVSPYIVLWQFVASVEIALIVYLTYNIVKNLVTLFTIVKDKVVEKLWVTPSVYQRIIKKAILLLIISLSLYPLNFVLALSNIEKDLIDLSTYVVIAASLVILATLVIDIIKAFEHIIKSRMPRI